MFSKQMGGAETPPIWSSPARWGLLLGVLQNLIPRDILVRNRVLQQVDVRRILRHSLTLGVERLPQWLQRPGTG